jgi:hypothetical protein
VAVPGWWYFYIQGGDHPISKGYVILEAAHRWGATVIETHNGHFIDLPVSKMMREVRERVELKVQELKESKVWKEGVSHV